MDGIFGNTLMLVLVAALWGCTNPFLKRASERDEARHAAPSTGGGTAVRHDAKNDTSAGGGGRQGEGQRQSGAAGSDTGRSADSAGMRVIRDYRGVPVLPRGCCGAIARLLTNFIGMLLNWQFFIPFALNQSGSILFYYVLSSVELSIAVPVCNSLTFVFTAITGYALGERSHMNAYTIVGMVLIVTGVTICLQAKTQLELGIDPGATDGAIDARGGSHGAATAAGADL